MIYRVDLHVHTDGAASLDELARAARRAGLDAIAVTDRGRLTPVPAEVRGVLLIPGCEIATLGGHILGVFLERAPDFTRLQRHGLPTADEAVLEIHRCGGLAILAHPYAEKTANAALFPLRPDAVETVNPRAALARPDANKRALLWAADHRRPRVGCSDARTPQDLGCAYTEISCAQLTHAALKEAVDLGRCRPVAVRDAAPEPRRRKKREKKSGGPSALTRGAAVLGCGVLGAVRGAAALIPHPRRKKRKKDE